MSRGILSFDYLWKDVVTSHVEVNLDTLEIKVQDFSDNVLLTVFGKRPHTIDNLYHFFRERVFDETNAGITELLRLCGLRVFDPLAICKVTHGRLTEDVSWIRWDGESLTWQDMLSIPEDDILRYSISKEEYYN